MNLIHPTFLYSLAGLTVPVIIHLIYRWQIRDVDLGTVRFLSELLRETARRRRIKQWLLLSLRLGCLTLLALLFARPFVLAQHVSGDGELLVILIDNSASMSLRSGGERLVDAAVHRALALAESAGSQTAIEIAFFDSDVHPVNSLSGQEDSAMSSLEAPGMSFGATRYGAALGWARDICLKSNHSQRDVHLLTDLQRSGLDWTDSEPFPDGVQVHIHDLGQDDVQNVALVQAIPEQTSIRPTESTNIAATFFNHSPFPFDDVPVRVTLQSQTRTVRLEETLNVPGHQAAELVFEVPPLAAGLWQGTVSFDVPDALSFDNRQFVALLSSPPRDVLIIDGTPAPPTALSEVFFLERAIQLAPPGQVSDISPFKTHTVRIHDADRLPPFSDYDVIVLANVGPFSRLDAENLRESVDNGGGLLVFTGSQVSESACESLRDAGLTPGSIHGVNESKDLPFRWDRWESTNTLLGLFSDPQRGDLRRLGFGAYTRVAPDASTVVHARFRSGEPALTEHALGQGRVLWFLSSCGREWGDWVRSRLYVPLVHQLLGDLQNLTAGGPIHVRSLEAHGQSHQGVVTGDPPWNQPGVSAQDGRWYVLNTAPSESETERCTAEELADRFQFAWIDETHPAQQVASASKLRLESHRNELWPWIACSLVGLLCLEWFVANRTTV